MISSEQKADAITILLTGVHSGQTIGLMIVMTVLPCLLMFLSYILYKKHYKLDEDEYERICAEIADRKAAKEA